MKDARENEEMEEGRKEGRMELPTEWISGCEEKEECVSDWKRKEGMGKGTNKRRKQGRNL